jgi:hypothetical protein
MAGSEAARDAIKDDAGLAVGLNASSLGTFATSLPAHLCRSSLAKHL